MEAEFQAVLSDEMIKRFEANKLQFEKGNSNDRYANGIWKQLQSLT